MQWWVKKHQCNNNAQIFLASGIWHLASGIWHLAFGVYAFRRVCGSSFYRAIFCMATLDNQDGHDNEYLEGTSDEQDVPLQVHEAANPIVYKLVRVEGDGTMVPATEDDVMEVECLLNGNRCYLSSKDVQNSACPEIMANNIASKDFPHKGNTGEEKTVPGPLDPKDTDQTLKAKFQFFNLLLQRVKEEERLRLASGITGHYSSYLFGKTASKKPICNLYQQSPNDVSHMQSSDSPNGKGTHFLSFDSFEEGAVENKNIKDRSTNMKVIDEKKEGTLILGQATAVPKPDPDFVRREISLDNLTIRELHEAFKTTFGRETSVKDKQWLKRRIAMALEDKVPGIKKQEEISARLGVSVAAECPLPSSLIMQACKSKLTADAIADVVVHEPDDRTSSLPFEYIVGKTEGGLLNDESQDGEEMAAKRVRKPTRRYIEETSEVESKGNSGRIVQTTGDSDDDYSPPTSRLRSSYSYGSWGTEFVSRHDSLGGSGIEVPYVSRVRRGRPRKNFNALLKYDPAGRAAKLVKKALGVRSIRCDGDIAETRQKPGVVTESNQGEIVHETLYNEEPLLVQDDTDKHCDLEYSNSNLLDEEYVPTVPTAKGGVRRKHHRPWTLRDVMKLVEGVSRCGVGKWADIKKVAFSSSAYRTSVDLKDKWRNLIRASNSQLQTTKEAESRRKHASVPIPAPILVRVRELSSMQSPHAACGLGTSVSRSGRTVHKKQQT